MRALVLVTILLTAGCVSVPRDPGAATYEGVLSAVRYATTLSEHAPLAMEDGAVMDAWVFRPDTSATGETVPVIINYSPYWSNLSPPAEDGGDPFSLYLIEYFVPRGYAVALVSVRGTGLSDGCFSIGGPQEIDDADAIATTLATMPWANGKVAAVAKSYDGTVAQGLLTRGNPHLATIVPVSPISEFYKYNYYGGVPYDTGGLIFNTYYVKDVSVQQSTDPQHPTYAKTPTRICDESVDVQASQYQSALVGDYTAYWQARNYTALLPDDITTSVFYVHGLQDWNVKPDHMVPWIQELRARDVAVKMWLGQWAHDYPHRDDWNATLLRWFDSELKGVDTGIRAEPWVQVQDDAGEWRDEMEWPPARAIPTSYYTDGAGTLGAQAGSGTSMYGDAPAGALANAPAANGVAFTMTMERAARIAGSPVLTATVSATGPRATLAAALLVDGKVVDQGFLDLAHRDGLASAAPLVPGQSYDVVVPFFPQDLVVPAGATLTLWLSGTSPAGAPVLVTPMSAPALVTITHGEGTRLELPLLEMEDVKSQDPQPEDVGCWTC